MASSPLASAKRAAPAGTSAGSSGVYGAASISSALTRTSTERRFCRGASAAATQPIRPRPGTGPVPVPVFARSSTAAVAAAPST